MLGVRTQLRVCGGTSARAGPEAWRRPGAPTGTEPETSGQDVQASKTRPNYCHVRLFIQHEEISPDIVQDPRHQVTFVRRSHELRPH